MLWINFFAWILPPFFIKGNIKNFLFFFSFAFSGSYWIPIALLPENFNKWSIREEYVSSISVFSIYAAIFFYSGLFLVLRRNKYVFQSGNVFGLIDKVPVPKVLFLPVIFFTVMALLYSFIVAISQIGIAGRVEFIDEIAPFWYSTLLPLLSLSTTFLVFYELKKPKIKINFSLILLLIILFFFNFLVGFDGGRRPIMAPLGVLSVLLIVRINSGTIFGKTKILLIVFLIFSALMATLLSFNRGFLVGWQIFNVPFEDLLFIKDLLPSMLLSPTPTLHVNTQMLQHITENGAEGYWSYFQAIGNTLFPKLILRFYVFGEPLVSALHARFGWYGQDFGFMAEAIFSDGLRGVILIHFLLGLIIGYIIKKGNKGSLFFSLLLFGLCFAFVNSLRSDFMNFLKAALYPTVFLFLAIKVSTFYFKIMKTTEVK